MTETTTRIIRRAGRSSARVALDEAIDDIVAMGGVEPGFYQMQLQPGAVWSPVRIWYGFGRDPDGLHFREVTQQWRACLNGVAVPFRRVWPACAWEKIGMAEYRYRLVMFRYAKQHERSLPEANPYKRVDWHTLKHDVGRK